MYASMAASAWPPCAVSRAAAACGLTPTTYATCSAAACCRCATSAVLSYTTAALMRPVGESAAPGARSPRSSAWASRSSGLLAVSYPTAFEAIRNSVPAIPPSRFLDSLATPAMTPPWVVPEPEAAGRHGALGCLSLASHSASACSASCSPGQGASWAPASSSSRTIGHRRSDTARSSGAQPSSSRASSGTMDSSTSVCVSLAVGAAPCCRIKLLLRSAALVSCVVGNPRRSSCSTTGVEAERMAQCSGVSRLLLTALRHAPPALCLPAATSAIRYASRAARASAHAECGLLVPAESSPAGSSTRASLAWKG
mmetsp:Transcript_23305/g.59727  ORF Transcript_23305/g.59727 Transcript_23305/m.59727 type:complete len:312 (+) Transcript_23305:1920-2855(+)